MSHRLQVLAVAPYCDGTDVGEAWCAFNWVSHLARHADVTLLTIRRAGWQAPSEQLPHVEVIEWDEGQANARIERFNSMLKPGYLQFYLRANRWINAALKRGRWYDVAHQFTPIALRYPSPLAGFPIPYVLGPLGGSLDTPPGFSDECTSSSWFTRLRSLDRFRLNRDPTLRHTYSNAAAILGVAPYVEGLLKHAAPKRFEVISELGIDNLTERQPRGIGPKPLNLLHVGRAVRTKGLRDAIRAVAQLPENIDVHLHSAGQGEELVHCKREAERLEIADRITFHGQLTRPQVEALYGQADLFLFPSFREPSGSVIFEAMRHGLPVITTNAGGPGFVVNSSCGITLEAVNPEQLATDLAHAIEQLARDEVLRARLAAGAQRRIAEIGLWDNKLRWLLGLYTEIVDKRNTHRKDTVRHA